MSIIERKSYRFYIQNIKTLMRKLKHSFIRSLNSLFEWTQSTGKQLVKLFIGHMIAHHIIGGGGRVVGHARELIV